MAEHGLYARWLLLLHGGVIISSISHGRLRNISLANPASIYHQTTNGRRRCRRAVPCPIRTAHHHATSQRRAVDVPHLRLRRIPTAYGANSLWPPPLQTGWRWLLPTCTPFKTTAHHACAAAALYRAARTLAPRVRCRTHARNSYRLTGVAEPVFCYQHSHASGGLPSTVTPAGTLRYGNGVRAAPPLRRARHGGATTKPIAAYRVTLPPLYVT